MSPPRPRPSLHLHLTGAPKAWSGSNRLPLERKAAGAVAWLALRGPTSRSRMAAVLWPDASPQGARNSLRQLIFKLKKALGAAVIEGQDELHLPADVHVDQDDAPLLADCQYDDCPELAAWVDEARRAHQQQLGQARAKATDAAIAEGDAARALTLARACVADDELSEPAHLRLVQALYLHGERAAALEAAAHCEDLLRRALGVEPSAAMNDVVALVRRAETAAASPRSIPVAVLRPPRLIGRQRDLEQLARIRAAAQVALLLGEPGLGKSRLLAEVCDAQAGWHLLGTRPGDATVPFAALARWLRTLLDHRPQLLADLSPALHKLVPERVAAPLHGASPDLSQALVVCLQQARSAGLIGLAMDDLHFADAASIETLASWIGEPSLAGLPWLLAARPAEGDAALGMLRDQLAGEGRLVQLELQPLDLERIAELVASLALPELDGAMLAPELLRSTGGNPMFVLETIKALLLQPPSNGRALPRPANVGALIERRLHQLSAPAQSLARVAALAGPDFSTDLAMAVLEMPLMALTDAWAELEAAQVLRDSAFAHDLIYEATLASVPLPIRRHARRAIAEFLAPRDAEPGRLAEHWLAAGLPARAAACFETAGRRAEAAARYAEARRLFERAADCHEQAGQTDKASDVLLALADLLTEAGQGTSALEVLAPLEAAGTVDTKLRVLMQRMHALEWMGRAAEAAALGEQALADPDMRDEATPTRLAMLRYQQAINLRTLGRETEALAQLRLAQPQLGDNEDAQWRGWFHGVYSDVLLRLGELAQAAPHAAQALEAARQVGRRRMVAGRLQTSATLASATGRQLQALDEIDECLLLMAETGGEDDFSQAVQVQRAGLLLALGRYGETLEPLERLALTCRRPYERDIAQVCLCELWAELASRRG